MLSRSGDIGTIQYVLMFRSSRGRPGMTARVFLCSVPLCLCGSKKTLDNSEIVIDHKPCPVELGKNDEECDARKA